MQTRPDLFGIVHKALRTRLYDLSIELACCDFTNPAEVAIARDSYQRTIGLLHEHHEHEDTFVHPPLAERAPELVAVNRTQHARVDVLLGELDGLVASLDGVPSSGARLCARYQHFL